MTVPEALKKLRKQRGWTQRQLAAELRKAEGTVKHWEMGLREPSAEICEKLGGLSTTLELADYWAECAGLPPYSGESLQRPAFPLARDAAIPPTGAQTRMELHAGLDIILDRAPEPFREKIAREITQGAGQFEHSPVSTAAGRAPTARERRMMRMLGKVLDSGNSDAIEAADKNLEVLAHYAEVVETVSPASSSRPIDAAAAAVPGTTPKTRRSKPRARSRSD